MNDILNNLIETCEWRNGTMGVPVCTAETAPCAKIIDSSKCPVLIKYFKTGEKIIKDLQENQDVLPMGRYGDKKLTNQEKFIQIFGIDAWQQMIVFTGLTEQFKEYWTSPYKDFEPQESEEN